MMNAVPVQIKRRRWGVEVDGAAQAGDQVLVTPGVSYLKPYVATLTQQVLPRWVQGRTNVWFESK